MALADGVHRLRLSLNFSTAAGHVLWPWRADSAAAGRCHGPGGRCPPPAAAAGPLGRCRARIVTPTSGLAPRAAAAAGYGVALAGGDRRLRLRLNLSGHLLDLGPDSSW